MLGGGIEIPWYPVLPLVGFVLLLPFLMFVSLFLCWFVCPGSGGKLLVFAERSSVGLFSSVDLPDPLFFGLGVCELVENCDFCDFSEFETISSLFARVFEVFVFFRRFFEVFSCTSLRLSP